MTAFRHKAGFGVYGTLLVIGVCVSAIFSLSTGGRTDVGLAELWQANDLSAVAVAEVRVPRTLAAALLGVNLGLAGLILQAITRNPLASPSILGINQGAALGIAVLAMPGVVLPLSADAMALVGALGAGLLTFAIAGGVQGRIEPMRLILGGIAVGAFAYAMVRFTYTLEDEIARSVVRWTVGDITDIRWSETSRLLFTAVPGFVLALTLSQRLNLMALGQVASRGVGADPRMTLLIGLCIAALLSGAAVSVAGPIAFAGLVLPHLAKLAFGHDHRLLVPITACLGAALLMLADGVSKLVIAPAEVPIGIVVALLGAPWFLGQVLFGKVPQ